MQLEFRDPHSQTGNPPEGWESEGQIRNRQYGIVSPVTEMNSPVFEREIISII